MCRAGRVRLHRLLGARPFASSVAARVSSLSAASKVGLPAARRPRDRAGRPSTCGSGLEHRRRFARACPRSPRIWLRNEREVYGVEHRQERALWSRRRLPRPRRARGCRATLVANAHLRSPLPCRRGRRTPCRLTLTLCRSREDGGGEEKRDFSTVSLGLGGARPRVTSLGDEACDAAGSGSIIGFARCARRARERRARS
jgi:hypothetical protein